LNWAGELVQQAAEAGGDPRMAATPPWQRTH
jgi:hypothetical protein